MKKRLSLAPVFAVLLLSSCNHAANEAIAKQVTHVGVYALTTSGLSEITQYARETYDPISMDIRFKLDQSLTQTPAPLAFVTNVPEAMMAEAKVFLLPRVEDGHWHRNFVDAADTKPLPASTESISGSIYKVTPSDLPQGATGFLCLWVKMPSANEDRMYVIRLN